MLTETLLYMLILVTLAWFLYTFRNLLELMIEDFKKTVICAWEAWMHKPISLKVEDYDKFKACEKLDELKDKFVIKYEYTSDEHLDFRGIWIVRFYGHGRKKFFKRRK